MVIIRRVQAAAEMGEGGEGKFAGRIREDIQGVVRDLTKGMSETIDSEGELTEMLRGVDVVDKDKKQSAWPIPLNKDDEPEKNISEKSNIENKTDTPKEENKNLNKDNSTT